MPHGHHIYANAYDMEKATMRAYSQYYHSLSHWKYVLRCCAQCPSINIPDQETDDKHPNPSPSIRFHIYNRIASCTKHGMLPLTNNNFSRVSTGYYSSTINKNIHLKKYIDDGGKHFQFHTSFFISAIFKLAFYIPRVQILGTNHCGDSRRSAFKCQK